MKLETSEFYERESPPWIIELKLNEVFVFGSNEVGVHGKGAAKQAMKWGAKWGQGFGHHGQTYAIPTKHTPYIGLKLVDINENVLYFIRYAKYARKDLNFLVTTIGCGYAGYKPEDIAPMFKDALDVPNIFLPREFLKILKNGREESISEV